MKHNLVAGLFSKTVQLGIFLILLSTTTAYAAGVVTNCTGQGLADAMNAGSGTITFSCGVSPVTITVAQPGGFNVIPGRSYTIDGGNLVTLTGADANRLFDIQASNAALALTKIILTHGNASAGGNQPTQGGAILNEGGQLVLDHATISNSKSSFAGGAIRDVNGTTTVMNSVIDSNQSQYGGGIDSSGALTLDNTILQNNQATLHEGGGLDVGGTVMITNSRIIGNSAYGDSNGGGGGINITAAGNVSISGSQLNNNTTPTQLTSATGGAIRNFGVLSVSRSSMSGNSSNDGGGLFDENASVTTLDNVVFDGNSGFDGGGGIYNNNSSMLTLTNVTFNGNYGGGGGGLFNYATVIVKGTTFSQNTSGAGSGMYNLGAATLTNSTFSGNSTTGNGGGFYNASHASLVNVTLSNNSAVSGGALFMDASPGVTTSLTNTILAYSSAGGNCSGTITSAAYTISSDNSCALTGLINGQNPNLLDPLLTPLGIYGGPTQVHILQPGSPAIAGILGNNAPPTDQRGLPRPGADGSYDIGAVERQSPEDIIFRGGFDSV